MGKLSKVNVWCTHYAKCLDQAIRTGERFSCAGCEFESNQDGKDEVLDMFSYYLLLAAIFFPGAYKVFWEEKRRQDMEVEGRNEEG